MKEKFLKIFGCEYEQEYYSPGRINLIGEHIDYNGGTVLPMAINLGTYGYLKIREDQKIRLYSMNFENIGVLEFTIDKLEFNQKNDWGNYVLGVIDIFIKSGYVITNGFDLMINGTIPNGSGLSSSASLEVLIGKILIDNNNLPIDDVKLALLAQKAENEFVGVNCGIMDQFIIANATLDGALSINTDSLAFETISFELKDHSIVVLNSNKKRGLVDSAYNQRRNSCESAFLAAKAKFGVAHLCQLSLEQLEKLQLTHDDYKRARHVIEEQTRVNKAIAQLKNGQVAEFGNTLYAGHNSLKTLFEVSCDELDFIIDECMKLGITGARMTGAGFGGCCIAIVQNDKVNDLDLLIKPYREKFGLELLYYVVKASGKTKKIN